jgi:hypothetical protein
MLREMHTFSSNNSGLVSKHQHVFSSFLYDCVLQTFNIVINNIIINTKLMWLQQQQRMPLQNSSGTSMFEENLRELSEKFQAKTNENGDFR